MKMYVAGQWIDKPQTINVVNPYDNSVIDTVPRADRSDVERALGSAVRGAQVMAKLPGYERWKVLKKAAELIQAKNEELGRLISSEEGKIIAEGRLEASRAFETIMGSAEEAKRLHGETVPLDGAPGGAGKVGLTIRVPCGVVAAISPFNFPLNLVCHKVGPALAAGNAVVLKPATDTPLSALKLTEILLQGLAARGYPVLDGLRRRDRGPDLRRPAGAQDHLHREPRGGRAHLPDGRHQEGHHGAGQQLTDDRHARRRSGPGRRRRDLHRLRQRGAGVHLDPARAHRRQGLRRLPRRPQAQGGGPHPRRPARREDQGRAHGEGEGGGARRRVGEGGRRAGGAGGDWRRAAGRPLPADHRRRREARDEDLLRRALRAGGGGGPVRRHRPGDRARQ